MDLEEIIKKKWTTTKRSELASQLNISIGTLYNIAHRLNLNIESKYSENAKGKKWSEEDILFLKENYNIISNLVIAAKLNRSLSSIVQKSKDLNIINTNIWNQCEIDILLLKFSKCESIMCLSKELNKSVNSVKNKAREFGLKRVNYFWSDSKISNLQTLFKEGHTDREISELIGKSITSVKTKRIKLLGKKLFKWTDKDIDRLKNLYSSTNINDLLILFPDRTPRQICSMARKIGLRKKSSLMWSDSEIDLLKINYSNKTIKELMILLNNKTKSQIVNKSKGLKLKKDEETFMRCFGLKTNIPKVLDKNGIWRTKVLKRGGFCCAVCGFKDKSGIGLQAHHIKPVRDCDKKEKYDINNGICLCVECHKKAYMKEYDFFETFIGILEA